MKWLEMNSGDDLDHFDTPIYPFLFIKVPPWRSWTHRKQSADHHVTDDFWKKSIIFRDTREHQEHDTKNLLSIPGPSSEKLMAEIDELKKPTLGVYYSDEGCIMKLSQISNLNILRIRKTSVQHSVITNRNKTVR